MKRNKQQKYRIKIIQEFHLNKTGQIYYDGIIKDYKLAYDIFTGHHKPTISAFKPYEFKFKNMEYDYIDDIDRNSIIPSMMKSFKLQPKSIEKFNNIIGGNNNA